MADEKLDLKWTPPDWAAPTKDPELHKTLLIKNGEKKTTYRIGDKPYIIVGRSDPTSSAEIFLDHSQASRNHAAILQDAKGSFYIVDLGSQHGTFLSKTKLEPYRPYDWNLMEGKIAKFGPDALCGKAQLKQLDEDPLQGSNQTSKTAYKLPQSPKAHKNVQQPTTSVHCNGTNGSVDPKRQKASEGNAAELSVKRPRALDAPSLGVSHESPAKRPRPLDAPALGLRDTDSQPVIGPQLPNGSANGHSNGLANGHVNGHATIGPQRREPNNKMNGHANGKQDGHFIGPSMPPELQNGSRGGDRMMGPQLPPGSGLRRQSESSGHRFEKPGVSQMARGNLQDRERDVAERSKSLRNGGGSNSSSAIPNGKVKCDKCDGAHPTERCPHFKTGREKHKDAWVNYGRKNPLEMGGSGGNFIMKRAQLIRQPGDGSCLFHSLCYGMRKVGIPDCFDAGRLRRELANYISRNAQLEIAGDTIEEWVKWDSRSSVQSYAQRMSVTGWGGGIEMAACARLKHVNVHVYQAKQNGYHRISCFDAPNAKNSTHTIHVCYQGGMHYDALVPY